MTEEHMLELISELSKTAAQKEVENKGLKNIIEDLEHKIDRLKKELEVYSYTE